MALGVDGGGMKIKIQITIESDEVTPRRSKRWHN
jgi:hypothetical protein